MSDPDTLSYPPRGLSREEAARYIGVGTTTFDGLVADGRMPKPMRLGKRVIWDRLKIEAAFADLDEGGRENFFDGGGLRAVGGRR
ncbi:MAG: helix-turn-helix transcriptional regulator [Reyranella sp.]